MFARKILIRSLSCIAEEGYISKDNALIKGIQSTSARLESSFEMSDNISQADEDRYGTTADAIIEWILTASADDEYLFKCKQSITLADTVPAKTYGYISSLPSAYTRHLVNSVGLDRITARDSFPSMSGSMYTGTGEVISVRKFIDYTKISLLVTTGHFVSFTMKNKLKKGLTHPVAGAIITVSGRVYSNKVTDPFETTLSRVTIT